MRSVRCHYEWSCCMNVALTCYSPMLQSYINWLKQSTNEVTGTAPMHHDFKWDHVIMKELIKYKELDHQRSFAAIPVCQNLIPSQHKPTSYSLSSTCSTLKAQTPLWTALPFLHLYFLSFEDFHRALQICTDSNGFNDCNIFSKIFVDVHGFSCISEHGSL